jgi:hypothetical protein
MQAFCTLIQGNTIVPAGDAINFETYSGFGSTLTPGAISREFVLQPGIYQVHFSADGVTLPAGPDINTVTFYLNGAPLPPTSFPILLAGNGGPGIWLANQSTPPTSPPPSQLGATYSISGDHLVTVSQLNSTIGLAPDNTMQFKNSCRLVITRLADAPQN